MCAYFARPRIEGPLARGHAFTRSGAPLWMVARCSGLGRFGKEETQ